MLNVIYFINLILLFLLAVKDIKTMKVDLRLYVLIFLINLIAGVYYFGFDAFVAFFSTFILCLILSVGLGGGDIKVISALAMTMPIPTFYYIPIHALIILFLSMCFASIYYIYLIIFKKRSFKEVMTLKIPFLPFILLSYIVVGI
ncbi:prepilin peptidase (plasmid) [Methanocaldococcus sp. 16A]